MKTRDLLQLGRHLQEDADRLGMSRSPTPEKPASLDVGGLYGLLVSSGTVRGATHKLFMDGHYARCVEQAFKCLNNEVKSRSGLASDGDNLMRTAFSANNPILRLNDGRTQSQKDEQAGYMDLFAGSMKGIRNPRAHDHKLSDEPVEAIELLTLANHLMKKLAQSKRVRRRKGVAQKQT